MNLYKRILYRPFFIRLFHWEYWSFHKVYGPIYIVWFWLCLRARSLFFFSASNPGIEYGGFLMESKKAIYDLMPSDLYPKTHFVKKNSIPDDLLEELSQAGFEYPLIGKPDIGGRGRGVKKLNNPGEVIEYAYASRLDFLIQEFVPFRKETGIFYYRFPDSKKGVITGIVSKEFLSVTGDGYSSVRELCRLNKRAVLQMNELEKVYGEKMDLVLPEGEYRELVPYGNHSRGTKFLDDSYLINRELTDTMDSICGNIDGFYYGRLDIRYHNWDELLKGVNFSVIEVNGAGSEPTHMYDPRHSIFYAWKEIIRHWIILWRISIKNRELKKGFFLRWKEGLKMFKDNEQLEKTLAEQDV